MTQKWNLSHFTPIRSVCLPPFLGGLYSGFVFLEFSICGELWFFMGCLLPWDLGEFCTTGFVEV